MIILQQSKKHQRRPLKSVVNIEIKRLHMEHINLELLTQNIY